MKTPAILLAAAVCLASQHLNADGEQPAAAPGARSALAQRVAKTRTVLREDEWFGFKRVVFDFDGHTAWIVEPKGDWRPEHPWTWTMQWADAFVDRTGVADLLADGWRHVTIDTFSHKMDEEGIRASRAFQTYLVDELGFNAKANLVGMSWGGFFSVRYAAAHPECVSRIYLDAPLLTFEGFLKADGGRDAGKLREMVGPWADAPGWREGFGDDPKMPVNMAGAVAKAGIHVLLLYGGKDLSVDPKLNSETFAERFKAAGGSITVRARPGFGHHPHGEDPGRTHLIADFFRAALPGPESAPSPR